LEYFKRENRLRGQLKYTVHFVVPKDIVKVVQGLLDSVVREMNYPIIREDPSNGLAKLRIEGLQQQVIARMKKKIEDIFSTYLLGVPILAYLSGAVPF
jgi:hypothetical protein